MAIDTTLYPPHLASSAPLTLMPSAATLLAHLVPPTASASRAPVLASATAGTASPAPATVSYALHVLPTRTRWPRLALPATPTTHQRAAATRRTRALKLTT